jgi:hypothetical protein
MKIFIKYIRLFFEGLGYLIIPVLIVIPMFSPVFVSDIKKDSSQAYLKMIDGLKSNENKSRANIGHFIVQWGNGVSWAFAQDEKGNVLALMVVSKISEELFLCYGSPPKEITRLCSNKTQEL